MQSDLKNRRLLIGIIVLGILILLIQSDSFFVYLKKILSLSEDAIKQYPIFGKFLFVILSALSAMLAFFSTALLVPIGVNAWGRETCFVLLWLGWFIGGISAYAVGKYAGSSLVEWLVGKERLVNFKNQIAQQARFIHIILFQAVLPSELPGYVLGAIKFRFHYYAYALAIVEFPYAIATVYLGESFIQRDTKSFVIVLLLSVFLSIAVYYLYKRQGINGLE